jgi:MFS family permease
LIGCLAYEFQVVLPVVARQVFHGGSQVYGFMTAAMGVGALVGGLFIATRRRTGIRPVTVGAAVFGLVILAAAAAPNLPLEIVALFFVGAGSVSFLAVGNSTLQLASEPSMRGRVMALWAVAFLGSTPIGGPIAGSVAEHLGGRWALVMGAMACFAVVAIAVVAGRRARVSAAYGGVGD